MAQAQSHSPDNILILGDFNAGNIYLDSIFTAHSPITPLEVNLHDKFQTLNLKQLINQPTRYTVTGGVANLRDLIAVSNNDMICGSGILPPFSNIDHLPVFATLKINSPSISRQSVQLTSCTSWEFIMFWKPIIFQNFLAMSFKNHWLTSYQNIHSNISFPKR